MSHREHVARLLGVEVDDLPTPGDLARDRELDDLEPPALIPHLSGDDPWDLRKDPTDGPR